MTHPVDTTYVNGVAVEKANVRALQKATTPFVVATAAQIGAFDLSTVGLVNVRATGATFRADPSWTGPADSEHILDLVGNNFTYVAPLAGLTAAQIGATLQASGGLPLVGIASGSADTFLGTRTAGLQHLPANQLPALMDAGLGSTAWRQDITTVTAGGLVAALPANARRCHGGLTRLWLMTDGLIQASGAVSGGVNGDVGGVSLSRPQSIPHPLGLRWTKVWSHNTAAYALDEQSRLYSWGAGHPVLGHGNLVARTRPTLITYFVTNGLTVVDVILAFSGGTSVTTVDVLFLCSNGKLYYAGANGAAQAGIGNVTAQSTPVEWANGALTGTIVGACIADEEPTVYAWNSGGTARCAGSGSYGQRGDGLTSAPPGNLSVAIALSGVTKIVACSRGALIMHNTTVTGSQASYAGYNSEGNGGQNATTPANLTTWTGIAALGSTVKDIEIGGSRQPTCGAIDMTNRLRLWGNNSNGQQGTGVTANVLTPTEPTGTWQGSVNSFAIASQAGFCGAVVQVSDPAPRLLGAGLNSRAQLSVGVAASPVTTFSPVLGLPVNATIQDWNIHGYTDLWGLTVRTTAGTFSGGYGGDGQNGIGDIRNLHTLQRVNFPALAGPQGAQGVGAWASPVPYAAGITAVATMPLTQVTYLGETYVCQNGHVTTSTFVSPNWIKVAAASTAAGPPGPDSLAFPIVAYTAGLAATATAPRTVVTYLGSTYVCTTSHATTSTFVPANWSKLAAAGDPAAGAIPLDGLTDVEISSPVLGQQIIYTAGRWTNVSGSIRASTWLGGTGTYSAGQLLAFLSAAVARNCEAIIDKGVKFNCGSDNIVLNLTTLQTLVIKGRGTLQRTADVILPLIKVVGGRHHRITEITFEYAPTGAPLISGGHTALFFDACLDARADGCNFIGRWYVSATNNNGLGGGFFENNVRHFENRGLYVTATDRIVQDVQITANNIWCYADDTTAVRRGAYGAQQNGFAIAGAGFKNCPIKDNVVSGAAFHGLEPGDNSLDIDITGNGVFDTAPAGPCILLNINAGSLARNANRVNVRKNRCRGGNFGLQIVGADGVYVTDNDFADHNYSAIIGYGSSRLYMNINRAVLPGGTRFLQIMPLSTPAKNNSKIIGRGDTVEFSSTAGSVAYQTDSATDFINVQGLTHTNCQYPVSLLTGTNITTPTNIVQF